MNSALTISQLHAAYATGQSPVAIVDRVFDAIEAAADPGIFISLAGRDATKAAARALGPFDPIAKPLWGIPFAVKDNIDVAGIPTTAACPTFAYTPKRSAFAVERLIAAGAVFIGKTNLDQFATGLVGVRTPYAIPRNAVDPDLVPGGSSSGSAIVVARGIVPFALGTDTAGSGRIPAALNNIVGLKPSLGAVSTTGVVPACRSLDCVSVFALTVEDASRVYRIMAEFDAADPYARPIDLAASGLPPHLCIGVPSSASIEFFGDDIAAAAFKAVVSELKALGVTLVDVDITIFREVAELLYAGPWVAERYQAIREFFDTREAEVFPVTREIIGKGKTISAADTFAGIYRLADLRRKSEAVWQDIDVLAVPSAPTVYTTDDLAREPVKFNSRLGTYTNFVNLLDLCALAVPGPFRSDVRPAGVTLISTRGRDGLLASLGEQLHVRSGVAMGATGHPLPPVNTRPDRAPNGWHEMAVVGAHLSGLQLNVELTNLGAVYLRAAATQPCYRLFALGGEGPARPGLLRVPNGNGHSIETEVWALPAAGFAKFIDRIPPPLGVGTVRLSDGTSCKGFLVEAEGTQNALDISEFGGWRNYLTAMARSPAKASA